MPDYAQGTVTQFNKGLITEASEMTFPEGASIDESNCDLFPDGSRRRRLGIELESGSVLSSRAVSSSVIVSTHIWENVAEQADTNWVVVQLGSYLKFYDPGASGALSSNAIQQGGGDYELDMSTFNSPTGNGASFSVVQVTSIKGALVVASPDINTFYLEYDPDAGTFNASQITFRVRDYRWMGDRDEYRSAVSVNACPLGRAYDTRNCGWAQGGGQGSSSSALDWFTTTFILPQIYGGGSVSGEVEDSTPGVGSGALFTYTDAEGEYPALTHPWYTGKNSSGDFKVSEWKKVGAGSSFITNGTYILDLYAKDRTTPSGIKGNNASDQAALDAVLNTTEEARFSTVETYAGRVWYSGITGSTDDNASKVFFSQQLDDGFGLLGECFQENDPTSEELSDLLDTDGGFVNIPGAHDIRKLHQFGADLYVFAENGVWRIAGVDGVFRATEYSVQKLSEDGIVALGSFISASGRPFWWSNNGIHTLGLGESGGVEVSNISISSIQTFFEDIGADKRALVRGVYDKLRRRVVWLYPDTTETNENKRNRLLILDEVLGAFIPWTVSDQSANTDYLVDAVFSSGVGSQQITYNVVDSSGNQIVDSSGNTVVVTRSGSSISSSGITALVVDGTTGSYTFGTFSNTDFVDWGDADYSSYAEAGYNFLGDGAQRKKAIYCTTYLRTTETGWEASGDGYVTVRPSGCLLTNRWDFRSSPSFVGQQLYRLKYPTAVDISDLTTYDYPATVVVSKIKLRGRGRVMTMKFESESGKDFHLIGYDVIAQRPGRF